MYKVYTYYMYHVFLPASKNMRSAHGDAVSKAAVLERKPAGTRLKRCAKDAKIHTTDTK